MHIVLQIFQAYLNCDDKYLNLKVIIIFIQNNIIKLYVYRFF